ncbi:putative coronin, partial [Toxoplasma gondii MAS]
DLLACTTKDKALNIVDPRAAQVVGSVACHDGSKACKCTWIDGLAGRDGHVFTTGFGKMQEREMAIWDTRKFDKPVYHAEIDRGSSPLYPIFDETTGMLYVCGKWQQCHALFHVCKTVPFFERVTLHAGITSTTGAPCDRSTPTDPAFPSRTFASFPSCKVFHILSFLCEIADIKNKFLVFLRCFGGPGRCERGASVFSSTPASFHCRRAHRLIR